MGLLEIIDKLEELVDVNRDASNFTEKITMPIYIAKKGLFYSFVDAALINLHSVSSEQLLSCPPIKKYTHHISLGKMCCPRSSFSAYKVMLKMRSIKKQIELGGNSFCKESRVYVYDLVAAEEHDVKNIYKEGGSTAHGDECVILKI